MAPIHEIDQLISDILLSHYHFGQKVLPVSRSVAEQRVVEKRSFDALDIQLCWILHLNGRATVKGMADRLGVAPQTVANRVSRLHDARILAHYFTRIYYVSLGSAFHVAIRLQIAPDQFKAALAKILALKPIHVHEVTGRYGLYLQVAAQNQTELRAFIRDKLENIEGIRSVDSAVILAGHFKGTVTE